MSFKNKKIIDLNLPIDHSRMMEILDEFTLKYNFLSVGSIGNSIMGRSIPIVKLGKGDKRVIYIGAHHGSEWLTCGLLLRFINEYCELYCSDGAVEGVFVEKLYDGVEINVIPMLNPDGVDYAINGIDEQNILYERLLSMNKESRDFTHWQANGRGVDLNHNYNFGFSEYKKLEIEQGIEGGAPTRYSGEHPESEPETGYLCNYIRFSGEFQGALSLHTQGEEIYYKSGEYCPNGAERIAKYISELCGYKCCKAEGMASYGGVTDWFIKEIEYPSFTLECGKGENPLPISDLPMIYIRIRRMLFELPLILRRFHPRKG